MLPLVYLWPINVVICNGTYQLMLWEISSCGGLRTYMLSALIRLEHSYRAFTAGAITRTLEVPSSRSSRTKEDSTQISCAYTGYGPNCLTTFWTQLACRFNGRTAQPLERTTAPGCDEPTSRCQTSPSMWTLGGDKPVIPMVTFIRWAMALPCRTTGSLYPSLLLLHSMVDFRPTWGNLWTPPLRFRRRPPQSNCLPEIVPCPVVWGITVRIQIVTEWYLNDD